MNSRTGLTAAPMTPAAPSASRLRPLGLQQVRITGGFWAQQQAVNAAATIPHIQSWLDREGWIDNFDRVVDGTIGQTRTGREFSDSEVYKFLEAMSWEIGRADNPDLERVVHWIVERVAAAQDPDGYLNTAFGHAGQPERWSDLQWGHELYCVGHLLQAAVARGRTRPDATDGLLQVATRAADLVCEAFSEDGIASICGHPVVEVGLMEFGRLTGDKRYLDQASLFLTRRGQGSLGEIEWGRAYFQDDVPIREATVLRGHAVRAGYLSAGATDLAVETRDEELLDALRGQWDRTVARRTYITGGLGSYHQTEAIGDDWALPPDRAYSETCAGVASVMFSWRLLLADAGPRFADLIERVLFNVVVASLSREGTSFFYANTLHQRVPGAVPAQDKACPRATSSMRAPWFSVSCCPPNVARTLASLAAYVATVDEDGLQLHQYAESEIRAVLHDGEPVSLDVHTDYPRTGVIRVEVVAAPSRDWTLSLRVPAWASQDATLSIRRGNGEQTLAAATPGVVTVAEQLAVGDVVELGLPVHARVVEPDPRIDALRGCVAVERGPEVFCLEWLEVAGEPPIAAGRLAALRLDRDRPLVSQDGAVRAEFAVADEPPDHPWPYELDRPEAQSSPRPSTRESLALVPYRDWANRGPSTMRVWMPALDTTSG